MTKTDQPPVSFFFAVSILEHNDKPFPLADASFREVSGISVTMETQAIEESGQNRFIHKVPGRTSYDDLVLRRGLMVRSSGLADWCNQVLQGNLNEKAIPQTVIVSLLDANSDVPQAIMTWKFVNAFPVKWEIGALDATGSEIVVESITFSYQYFERQ